MDIEDTSAPYRAFLRSGPYPALSQRVLRSGGVLAQAAGWFALVVTAASAGYNVTQRFATPSTATGGASIVRPAARPALARSLGAVGNLGESPTLDRIENAIVPEGVANADRRVPAHDKDNDKGSAVRKRAGGVLQPVQPTAAEPAAGSRVEVAAEPSEPARAEQITERAQASVAEPAPVLPVTTAAPDPIESVLRESVERQRLAALKATRTVSVVAMPAAIERVAPPAPPAPPRQPLVAAARVDAVNVRGPLSAAQLRRSVERVRPTLSECYAGAAQRAGHNHFAQVRVTVTIDEAGRVKAQPHVEGAQLPGFAECLSSAMSKLVCQAPDTGTAKAAIVLGFKPERE